MSNIIDITRHLRVRAALSRNLILVALPSETHEDGSHSVLMTKEAYDLACALKKREQLLWPCEVAPEAAAYFQAYGGASEKIYTTEDVSELF